MSTTMQFCRFTLVSTILMFLIAQLASAEMRIGGQHVRPISFYKCYCNMPSCIQDDFQCETVHGCFLEMQQPLTAVKRRDMEVGEFIPINGSFAAGCLDQMPTKMDCDQILTESEVKNDVEFPALRMNSRPIQTYRCCTTSMCNRIAAAEDLAVRPPVVIRVPSRASDNDDYYQNNVNSDMSSIENLMKELPWKTTMTLTFVCLSLVWFTYAVCAIAKYYRGISQKKRLATMYKA